MQKCQGLIFHIGLKVSFPNVMYYKFTYNITTFFLFSAPCRTVPHWVQFSHSWPKNYVYNMLQAAGFGLGLNRKLTILETNLTTYW